MSAPGAAHFGQPLDGRRRFRGTLLSFASGVARLLVDGSEYRIPFDAVARAHTIYRFTRADFAKAGAAGPSGGPSAGAPRGSAR